MSSVLKIRSVHFNRSATYCCFCTDQNILFVYDLQKQTSVSQRIQKPYQVHHVQFCDNADPSISPSNVLVMTMAAPRQKYPTVLALWNHMNSNVNTALSMDSPIKGIDANASWVVCAQKKTTTVHTLEAFVSSSQQATADNTNGLCTISAHDDEPLVITLGQKPNTLLLFKPNTTFTTILTVLPENDEISYFCSDAQGERVAVSNRSGDIIRVWNSQTGAPLLHLRRGFLPARILCMQFDLHSQWLMLYSDRHTVHIYGVGQNEKQYNCRSKYYQIIPFLPNYFSSSWSAVNFKLPDPCTRAAVSFQWGKKVCIVSYEGRCYIYQLKVPPKPESGSVQVVLDQQSSLLH